MAIYKLDQESRRDYEQLKSRRTAENEVAVLARMAEQDKSNQAAVRRLVAEFGWLQAGGGASRV